jgi:hypothetical protein
MKMIESKIVYDKTGRAVAMVGPDAVNLHRAVVLRCALGLLSKGITPTRGLTMTKALAMVKEYTGHKYKRTEFEQARTDLMVWINNMKLALPSEER